MNLKRGKTMKFLLIKIKKNKKKIILLPFYFLLVIIIDIILGICTENLWDKINNKSRNN